MPFGKAYTNYECSVTMHCRVIS